jgi:hypothetical protein
MTMTIRRVASLMLAGASVALFGCATGETQTGMQPYSGKEEAKNMRLVGYHDLSARTAYQPTIKKQGDRWIAYVGSHGGRMVNPLTGQLEENGTNILDVTDPKSPKLLHHIPGEKGRVVPGRETGGGQMARVCLGSELPKADKSKVYLLRSRPSRRKYATSRRRKDRARRPVRRFAAPTRTVKIRQRRSPISRAARPIARRAVCL